MIQTCDCGKPFEPASRGQGVHMCRVCVTNRRRFSLKKRAVKYLGGSCIDCGYNKCLTALEFDHLNPDTKEFQLSGNHCLSWEKIKTELDKCVLRCANCHRERHDSEVVVPKSYVDLEPYNKTTVCSVCKSTFEHYRSTERKYCSTKCAGKNSHRIEWPPASEVVSMLKLSNFVAVASVLGVSDNAIRKFLRRNEIDPKSI